MATSLTRRVIGLFAVLMLAVLTLTISPGAAHAADGYRYWNYFHVENGKYAFAQTGPAEVTPKDGSVEAYRYGLSSTAEGLTPRTEATTYTVEDICADSEAKAGEKRVGVLLDFGTEADAEKGETPPEPRAACAVVPADATGQQVLDAVADVRVEDQLTCGIDGYPVKGCSVTVKNPPAAAAEQAVDFQLPETAEDTAAASAVEDDENGLAWPLVGVLAAVVLIGGAALALSRRNKSA